jgi:hypothetical protein
MKTVGELKRRLGTLHQRALKTLSPDDQQVFQDRTRRLGERLARLNNVEFTEDLKDIPDNAELTWFIRRLFEQLEMWLAERDVVLQTT